MKIVKVLIAVIVVSFMASCSSYFRMVTTIDRSGKASREIYTKGDSAFMAGDIDHNPYLFDLGPDWELIRFDSISSYNFWGKEKEINVLIKKESPSIGSFSMETGFDERVKSLVAPEETLIKKYRFFYTNYTLTVIYRELDYNMPVAIDKYLSEEERKLWSQGNFSSYEVMNGMELKNRLDDIENKFMDWFSRNCFEISLNNIGKWLDEEISDVDKEQIYSILIKKYQDIYIDPEAVCKALDDFYKSDHFTEIYRVNKKLIDESFEEALSMVKDNVISYELLLPGKVITTNAPIVTTNSLIWKVDGMRILFDDYTLTAEYRVMNVWSVVAAVFILIMAIISMILLLKRKKL